MGGSFVSATGDPVPCVRFLKVWVGGFESFVFETPSVGCPNPNLAPDWLLLLESHFVPPSLPFSPHP